MTLRLTPDIEGDRRLCPRVELERPCKIYEPRSAKYLDGVTRNVSPQGLLIDIPRVVEIKPGDALHVGVAMKRRHALLHSHQMLQAVVVRAVATVDDHTAVAVKFADSPASGAPLDVAGALADDRDELAAATAHKLRIAA